MGRYLSWLANAGLLVLCCFLLAKTANAVFAAWLTPGPQLTQFAVAALQPVDRSWEVRESILNRNLFHAMLPPPPPPPPVVEQKIEATKLPLALIGTVASQNPRLAWAALNDIQSREHLVLQVGDDIKGKAKVDRIEARRILLSENGSVRELVLDDETVPPPRTTKKKKKARAKRARTSRKAAARRAKQQAVRKAPPAAEKADSNLLTQFFSEVQIVPKYVETEMVGVQVTDIQPGGVFAGLGIQSGDVITEINGVKLESPEDSIRILGESVAEGPVNLKVLGEQGEQVLALPVQ